MLPPLLLLTDRRAVAGGSRGLLETVRAAVRGGARAVVLREKDLDRTERVRLARALQPVLADAGGVLLGASDPTLCPAGVHLAAGDPLPHWSERPPVVGRSCHDGAALRRAATERCTYATLSPVFPTASKPGYGPPLGPARLHSLLPAGLPVYALGGIRPPDVGACREAGVAGVVVMGAVMGAEDPTAAVAALLRAWHAAETAA
jgi:thiamine-phosphate pyrophosphorylase